MSWLLALVMSSFVGAPAPDCMIVEFTTDNCGPCQQLQPAIDKLKDEGWIVRSVNVTREPLMVSKFAVKSVPTLVLISHGKEVDRIVGAAPYEKILPRLARLLLANNVDQIAAASQSAAPRMPNAMSPVSQPGRSGPAARAEQWPLGGQHTPALEKPVGLQLMADSKEQASAPNSELMVRGQSPSSGAFPMLAAAASTAISAAPSSQSIADKFNERTEMLASQAVSANPATSGWAATEGIPANFAASAQPRQPSQPQRLESLQPVSSQPALINSASGRQLGGRPSPQPLDPQAAIARAEAATVRIRVDEENSTAYGTGTIIDVHGDEALVLTCGHLFREMKKHSQLTLDLFPARSQPVNVPAQLIDFKADAGDEDIGLISFRLPYAIEPVALLPQNETLSVGQPAFSFGCDHGDNPTRRDTQVKSINRYLGAPNVEIAGAPAVGRSGGGLFDNQGRLIGVCNAADAEGDEGIYAAAASVYTQIERVGLGHLVNSDANPTAIHAPTPTTEQNPPPDSPAQLASNLTRVPERSAAQMTCIVSDANGQQKVIKIDSPSNDLLDAIFRQASN